MNLATRLEAIRATLTQAAPVETNRAFSDPSGHGGHLAPPWSERELCDFETTHRIVFPTEYRAFLGAVGSAGAGPGHGLIAPRPLERDAFPRVTSEMHLRDGSLIQAGTPYRPSFGRAALLARPFPLAGPFTSLSAYDLPALPEDATPYDGALELCSRGCGYFDFLVVSGPWAGQVWRDTMAAVRAGAIVPTGRGFLDWYEDWLRDACAPLRTL